MSRSLERYVRYKYQSLVQMGPFLNPSLYSVESEIGKQAPQIMATTKLTDFIQTPFDFLIVGGGTAGLVLANRLSEESGIEVGIIEAGSLKLGDPKVDLPTGSGQMLSNPDYDWNFESTPQVLYLKLTPP
jgi:hypothetical protein